MQLVEKLPIDEYGDEFESEIMCESNNLAQLKNMGWEIAVDKGCRNRMWISETVFGDKRISEVKRWFMHLPDNSLLIIS